MKELYVYDLKYRLAPGVKVALLGWIKAKRDHGEVVFHDVCDSTGSIQVVTERRKVLPMVFALAKQVVPESAIAVEGVLIETGKPDASSREISAEYIKLIGPAKLNISPQPRSNINIFEPGLQEQLMGQRHLYLRNERLMAVLRFRHILTGIIHQWFRDKGFIEIAAPILTPTPLYDDSSAIPLEVQGQQIFLTQCVGFYLESAVHAFEKVYNIGPSFRGEESRSKRHLMEYWHVKAEVAFGHFEDIVSLVEYFIRDITARCCEEGQSCATMLETTICPDGLNIPFPRISYAKAIELLRGYNIEAEFGKSFHTEAESALSNHFQKPFWVTGIPRIIEPFPNVIDPEDPRVTKTADLIASGGYGELLGVAEKIHTTEMLEERLQEKGKGDDTRYEWLREMRKYGCVPHVGFGMGVERLIRWLLRLPHVRDTIPFFRIFGRRIEP